MLGGGQLCDKPLASEQVPMIPRSYVRVIYAPPHAPIADLESQRVRRCPGSRAGKHNGHGLANELARHHSAKRATRRSGSRANASSQCGHPQKLTVVPACSTLTVTARGFSPRQPGQTTTSRIFAKERFGSQRKICA